MAELLLEKGIGATRVLQQARAEAQEWDEIATALNRWGVLHVMPTRQRRRGVPRTPAELFRRMALSGDARLREASVLLLLTHPDLADDARVAICGLTDVAKDRAMRRYVAAAALQRTARTRIAERLGPQPLIPPDFLEELALPSLDEDFGRAALLETARQEESRYGYDGWRTYTTLLDSFLAEFRRRDWGRRASER